MHRSILRPVGTHSLAFAALLVFVTPAGEVSGAPRPRGEKAARSHASGGHAASSLLPLRSATVGGVSGHPGLGASSPPSLVSFVALERSIFPQAEVTGRFADWREVSRYRSRAGLHLGYDIALPAGTPVLTPWEGRVVAVLPWYGAEHGISVQMPGGLEVTFGHLKPRVACGTQVHVGDTIGTVVNDHVDIKMRTSDGLYYDFGVGSQAVVYAPGQALTSPRPNPQAALRAWFTARFSVDLAEQELQAAQVLYEQAQQRLAQEAASARLARTSLATLEEQYNQGLIARVELERAHHQAKGDTAGYASAQAQVRLQQAQRSLCRLKLQGARTQLASCDATLALAGVSVRERLAAEQALRKGPTPQLKKLDQARQHQQQLARKARLQRATALKSAEATAEKLERLFEQGAVSRQERDRAFARVRALGGRVPGLLVRDPPEKSADEVSSQPGSKPSSSSSGLQGSPASSTSSLPGEPVYSPSKADSPP